jgi:hypothetical protein
VVGAAAAVAAAGLLAGCTGSGGAATAAGAPRQVASPAAATTPAGTGTAGTADTSAELARGLLPADAFGPGATVVPVSLAELQQRLAAVPGGIGAALAGVTVTPTPCAAALEGVGAGLAGVDGLAGEGARTGSGGTAEALVTGGPVTTAVGTVTDLVTACPHVEVSSPHGSATVDLAPVDLAALRVPALGDGAAAVRATAVLTPAAATGRAPVTVSGLLAVVRDHDRLLLLGTAAPGATAPDDASFASLLQQAYATAHALG